MSENLSGRLVEQPFANSMSNMSNKDQTDRDARSLSDIDKAAEEERVRKVPVIQPAEPTNCPGKGICKGCRECNPVPRPYA